MRSGISDAGLRANQQYYLALMGKAGVEARCYEMLARIHGTLEPIAKAKRETKEAISRAKGESND